MTTEEHLKRVLSDLRAKERVASDKAHDEQIKAEAFREAANVVEIELTRLSRNTNT